MFPQSEIIDLKGQTTLAFFNLYVFSHPDSILPLSATRNLLMVWSAVPFPQLH